MAIDLKNLNIQLTRAQTELLLKVVLIVGGVGYGTVKGWLVISGWKAELRKQLDQVNAEIDTDQVQIKRKPMLELELDKLKQQQILAEQKLPRKKEVPLILGTISSLAASLGVNLTSFNPPQPRDKDFFYELPFPLVAVGSYHGIGKFFAAIALEKRLFNVLNVSYSSSGDGKVQVNFTFLAYQYKG